jgi:uncharacterized repeat protein (TIGR01451 family)
MRRALTIAAGIATTIAIAAAGASAHPVDATTDLAVTQTASADQLLVGQTLTITVTVTNNGPDPATKVTLREGISGPKATIASATPDVGQPCSLGATARRIRCLVGTLGAGQQAQVTVTVNVAASGMLTATGDALGFQIDPNSNNNEASTQTRIRETDAPVQVALTGDALTLPLSAGPGFPLSWKAYDTGSGVAGYDVRYRAAPWSGVFGPYVSWRTMSTDTHGLFIGKPGWEYCFELRAVDHDGNASPWTADQCATLVLPPRAATSTGAWTVGATSTRTRARGAALQLPPVAAKRILVEVVKCPTCGTLRVLWSGKLLGTIPLTASTRSRALVPLAAFSALQRGILRLEVASANRSVTVDGFGLLKR